MRLDKLELNEKLMLVSFVLDSLKIDIENAEEGDHEFQFAQIRKSNIECILFKSFMIGETYKLPLTLCLLGFNETLIGIRATIY